MNVIKKQKILFLIPTLGGGGAERVIVTLLNHLDRSQFEIAIGVVDTRKSVYQNEIPADVELIDLGVTRVRYAMPKIAALIWNRRPNIVFSTLGHLNLALAMIRFLLPKKVRFIARETNIVSLVLKVAPMPTVWRALYRWFYKRHDLLVCQSHYMQNDMVEQFDFPHERSIVINNPVDVDRIRQLSAAQLDKPVINADATRLVAAGRMTEVKGFDLLIEAIAILEEPRIRLVLLGDGPLLEELKQLADAKGVASQVEFLGFQSNPYLWFAHSDAFVLSSRYEGFPNVVLEALACGTPVIATPAPGGAREILDAISECVVARDVSAQALADAIDGWLKGERKRIDSSAIAPYRLECILDKYNQVLK